MQGWYHPSKNIIYMACVAFKLSLLCTEKAICQCIQRRFSMMYNDLVMLGIVFICAIQDDDSKVVVQNAT